MLHDYLCLISAAQDDEDANETQQHLDSIKAHRGFAAQQSCIHSESAYSM